MVELTCKRPKHFIIYTTMNTLRKIYNVELRCVIWTLLGLQVLMFSIMLAKRDSFERFHLSLMPIHDMLYAILQKLPFWQVTLLATFWTTILLLLVTIIIGFFMKLTKSHSSSPVLIKPN